MKHHMKKGQGHKSHYATHRKHSGAGGHDPNHAQANKDHGLPADCFGHGAKGYGGGAMAEEGNASGSNDTD